MTVECRLCGEKFKSLITSTHLKKHNFLTAEYKERYGKESLTSPTYRAKRAKQNSGKNNPNFGNEWTEEKRNQLSQKMKGSVPWNKGIKLGSTGPMPEQTKEKIRKANTGKTVSEEVRNKISNSVKEYFNNNPEELELRAKKATDTKIKNGYYRKKKERTILEHINRFEEHSLVAEHIEKYIYQLTCKNCETTFVRGAGQWHNKMCPGCTRENSTSVGEQELYNEVKKLVPNLAVLQSDKTQLYPFELDIYIPEKRIALEYNGLYWHSESAGKSRWYHKKKLEECRKKNIQLIQIFEDEWKYQKDKVVDRIKAKLGVSNKTAYARKCVAKKIGKKEAFAFFKKYHIQGQGQALYSYGLYCDNKLVAAMSFSKLNRAKGYTDKEGIFELNRYCSAGSIAGGAGKLFKKFVSEIDPSVVITYSDLRWNTGNMYSMLGFEFVGETTPGYWYVSGDKRIHRYKLRKRPNEPKDKTEQELRLAEGYSRIWDCGHAKYVWTK